MDEASVEIRRSARARRSVRAFREDGRFVVVVPARMSAANAQRYADELVQRLRASEQRAIAGGDAALMRRARRLSRDYLDGAAQPSSVRWVDNQFKRFGSCTPATGTIRLSRRLASMPDFVIDDVLLHELAHLLVPGHGPAFQELAGRLPRHLEADAFLDGVSWAASYGVEQSPPDQDDDLHGSEGRLGGLADHACRGVAAEPNTLF